VVAIYVNAHRTAVANEEFSIPARGVEEALAWV
jgi:hypothetical protein